MTQRSTTIDSVGVCINNCYRQRIHSLNSTDVTFKNCTLGQNPARMITKIQNRLLRIRRCFMTLAHIERAIEMNFNGEFVAIVWAGVSKKKG